MITKEEVEHIAKLARLELTENEKEKMQKDLSAILDYVNLLKKAPSPDENQQFKPAAQYLRADEARTPGSSVAEKLIAAAPDKKDEYIKVKTILQ